MDKIEVFRILGIEETKDEDRIKNAYREKLVNTNPEDDPDGFRRLREAYETAVRLITEEENETKGEETEVDLWINKVQALYHSWKSRLDVEQWKNILSDEVCLALDTSDEATEKFLVFLMDCYNFTHEIWEEINKTFDYLNLKSEIREKFPPNFYSFVCNQITHNTDFLNFDMMEGPDDAPYDSAIDLYYELKRRLDEKNYEDVDFDNLFSTLDSYGIYHPYFELEKLRYEMIKEDVDVERVRSLVEALKSYDEYFYIMAYLCDAYIYLQDLEAAKVCIEKSRELNPRFMSGALCEIRFLLATEQYMEAKEKSTDYLDQYGNQPEALNYMHAANEKLMEELREKAKTGDADSLLELGWCLFQNEQFDECISMLSNYEPDEEHTFDYNNLRGRCTLASGDCEAALPYLIKWLEALEKLEDDGSEKYQRRIRRLGYSHYTVAACYASKAETLSKQQNADENNVEQYFKLARKHMQDAIDKEQEEREILYYKERMAYLLIQSGKNQEAIKLCNEILEEAPQYYPAYCDRQLAYFNLKDGQGVVDDFYNAIEIYDEHVQPYILAVKAFLGYNQYGDAQNIINRALEKQLESDELALQHIIVKRCLFEGEPEEFQVFVDELRALKQKILSSDTESDIEDISEIDYQIAITYMNTMDEPKLAMDALEDAIKIAKKEKYLWAKADFYERHKNYQAAYNTYVELGIMIGINAERYYRMARCAKDMGDSRQHVYDLFKMAYDADDRHYAVNDFLSEIYHDRYQEDYDKENYEKALFHANKQVEVNPNAYVLINRGLLYLDGGEFEKAIADFQKAMEYDPDDLYAYNNTGYAYKRMKQYDKAYEFYQKGLQCNTTESKRLLYRNLYILHLIQGNYKEAEKLFHIFEENDKYADSLAEMTEELYERQGQYRKAILMKNKYETRVRDKIEFYESQAKDALLLGELKEAEQYHKKVKKILKSEYSDIKRKDMANKAQAKARAECEYYNMMGDYYQYGVHNLKKAAEAYENMYSRKENMDIFLNLCRIYYKLGQTDKVQFYFDKAMEYIKSRYSSLENYLDYTIHRPLYLFQVGELYYYNKQYDKAKECFDKMEGLDPCSMCHYDVCYERIIGQALIEKAQGNKELALDLFRQAVAIDPEDFESRDEIKELEQ